MLVFRTKGEIVIILFAILISALTMSAQNAILSLSGGATVRPGQTHTLSVVLGGNVNVSGVQFNVASSATIKGDIGVQASAVGKNLNCTANFSKCIVIGMNATPIAAGEVARLTFTAPASGTVGVTLSGALATDPTGTVVPVSVGTEFLVAVLRPEDLNEDGKLDAADVQVATDQALERVPCGSADRNGNGKCEVTDVQLQINAVLAQ